MACIRVDKLAKLIWAGQLMLSLVLALQMLVKPAEKVLDFRTEVTGATEATMQVHGKSVHLMPLASHPQLGMFNITCCAACRG